MRCRRLLCVVSLALVCAAPAGARDQRRTAVVEVVERVAPAVVNVATADLGLRHEEPTEAADPTFEEFFRQFSEPRLGRGAQLVSLGSGVIVDSVGHVVTNEHVVRRSRRLLVQLADKRVLEVTVVGSDPASDIAVLRIEGADSLPFAPLGKSGDMMIGETLVALGNPFGLSHTVTTGVLSATGRSVRAGRRMFADFLQTDAAINPGNSGGPLVNLDGEVIGIATAIHASGQGIGFAIPSLRVRRVVQSLLNHGTVKPVWIGLSAQPAGVAIGRALGLAPGQGVVVTHVVPAAPAFAAGIRRGDVVYQVGGRAIGTPDELDTALWHTPVDRSVRLRLARGGERRKVTVKPLQPDSHELGRIVQAVTGLTFVEGAAEAAGVRVADVSSGSRAEARGFRPGDVIHEVDGAGVHDLASLFGAFYDAMIERQVLVLVGHGEDAYYVPLRLD